jgi:hypothetical protein
VALIVFLTAFELAFEARECTLRQAGALNGRNG